MYLILKQNMYFYLIIDKDFIKNNLKKHNLSIYNVINFRLNYKFCIFL